MDLLMVMTPGPEHEKARCCTGCGPSHRRLIISRVCHAVPCMTHRPEVVNSIGCNIGLQAPISIRSTPALGSACRTVHGGRAAE